MAVERNNQLLSQREVGRVVSELLADPKWEIFVRHVQELADRSLALAGREKTRLVNDILKPEEYLECKVKLALYSGESSAFQRVIELAKTLVLRGEEAAKEVATSSEEPHGIIR